MDKNSGKPILPLPVASASLNISVKAAGSTLTPLREVLLEFKQREDWKEMEYVRMGGL